MRMIVVALALAALLGGCVGPTPYQPATSGWGYSERLIEPNRYRVSFRGNSRTPREAVESYVLYRAAELTLAGGHDYFRVADGQTEVETRYRTTVTGFGPVHFGHGYSWGLHTGISTGVSTPITRYEAIANIVIFDGPKPTDATDAYDAAAVIETLGPLIRRAAAQQ